MYRPNIGGPNALWTPKQNFGGAMAPVYGPPSSAPHVLQ